MTTSIQTFVTLSAALTGISKSVLAPTVTNLDLPATYFDAAKQKFPADFDLLLNAFQALIDSGKSAEDAVAAIMENDTYAPVAQQINFLWYMGGWAVVTDFGTQTQNLSAITYQKGMVWQVMQSHPMGYSVSRYGYWGQEPAPLNNYIGNGE